MNVEVFQGSMVLVLAWLVVGGLGAPLPEDLALLGAGVLVARGEVDPVIAVSVALAGVLVGDALLFFLARRLGRSAYDRRLFRRILPLHRRARIEDAFRRYGGRLVFFARYVMGLRAAVFAMAGIHRMRPRRFLLWDAAAASVSVPLVVGLGYVMSLRVDRASAVLATVHQVVLLAIVVAIVGLVAWRAFRSHRADHGFAQPLRVPGTTRPSRASAAHGRR